jgi:hypothetical protein
MKRTILLATVAALATGPIFAQTPDAAPMDLRQLVEALKQLRELNESGTKSRRASAYQQVAAAASSPERAVAYWKEAVRAVQFEGAEREGAQLKDWREGDGEALSDRLCAGAVRLHLSWLALNLQHAAGAEMKLLLPKVLEHVAAVQADELAAAHLADNLEKAKERNPNSPGAKKNVKEDSQVKRVHDQIMRLSVANSPVARWLQLGDMFADAKRKAKEGAQGGGQGAWELVAGNVEGIYHSVILPEYRAAKDPRLLEYWDMVLKRESDRVQQNKLDVEQRDWTTLKRPAILWNRAQDVLLLGQRNRAIGEMFNLIKTFPQHPDAANWIGQLEGMIMPSTPAPAPAAAPATPAPATTGSVAPPAAVPPAVTPGAAIPATPGVRPLIR